ncbi:hypothetical protein YB2330_005165 [Saitoella coloradoensis]
MPSFRAFIEGFSKPAPKKQKRTPAELAAHLGLEKINLSTQDIDLEAQAVPASSTASVDTKASDDSILIEKSYAFLETEPPLPKPRRYSTLDTHSESRASSQTRASNAPSRRPSLLYHTSDLERRPSRAPSHAGSLWSQRSGRRKSMPQVWLKEIDKYELMAEHLYKIFRNKDYFSKVEVDGEPVIAVRRDATEKTFCMYPPEMYDEAGPFQRAIMGLNVEVAVRVSTKVVRLIMGRLKRSHGITDLQMIDGSKIQIVENLAALSRARKLHFAAFVKEEQILVVWADAVDEIETKLAKFEQDMIALVWKGGSLDNLDLEDEEAGMVVEDRPWMWYSSMMVGMSVAGCVLCFGLSVKEVIIEIMLDFSYARIALLAVWPVYWFFAFFFALCIVFGLFRLFGPISQVHQNSRYYSGKPPKRLQGDLPHVSIQCPVYKESLDGVIDPTVRSIKAAISTYELQGGTASIFMNDDGMQLLSEEDAEIRRLYYEKENIGWVARPPHGKDGFVRAGRFKKASNMNFALSLTLAVEKALEEIPRDEDWTVEREGIAYNEALKNAVEATGGKAWADGDIRVGDYIMIIDSDTRVPEDCILDAVSEMEMSPEVAILQHASGVMQVVWNYWENGITFFTDLVYTAIQYGCANGDIAPFVGHNAFLRWSAVQEVSFYDENHVQKFWSESHVSEDFDIALRLQVNGYLVRLAAYTNGGFKEGVSLTVQDELMRWEKYAYGCSELMFNPVFTWFRQGPFTQLFKDFVFSNMKTYAKLATLAYIGTYYAIAFGWMGTLMNYFITGWIPGTADHFYLDSWKIWFSVAIVFSLFGNFTLAVMRHRMGTHNFVYSLWENFKWVPLFAIFFGGLSVHVSYALICHMFSLNIGWGATAKELEDSNFFVEAKQIARGFRNMYVFSFLMQGMILALAFWVPLQWRITSWVAIVPLEITLISHMLLPLVLNPFLMNMTF